MQYKTKSGKLSKHCLTLDEKIKILEEEKNEKRKLSCKEITEEFNIGKTQSTNVIANEAPLSTGYENFEGKDTNMLNVKSTRNINKSTLFFTSGTKNVKPSELMSRNQ